jgi:hypothetical protein
MFESFYEGLRRSEAGAEERHYAPFDPDLARETIRRIAVVFMIFFGGTAVLDRLFGNPSALTSGLVLVCASVILYDNQSRVIAMSLFVVTLASSFSEPISFRWIWVLLALWAVRLTFRYHRHLPIATSLMALPREPSPP